MTTLVREPAAPEAGGAGGCVLAVVDLDAPCPPVLRYARLVAAVDGRELRVLVLRRRLGLTTDAALVAARRRARRRVEVLVDDHLDGSVEVDELVVSRRTARDPDRLGRHVLSAARARGAGAVVVPQGLAAALPASAPGLAVVTVLARPRAR